MEFSESGADWRPIPGWVGYLIGLGIEWAASKSGRIIGVISMPCESAGAALVALGAICYRLSLEDAGDPLSHFERLQRIAETKEGDTILRHQHRPGRWYLERKDQSGILWARHAQGAVIDDATHSGPTRMAILEENASDWRLAEEPPAETVRGSALPHQRCYQELFDDLAPPLEFNYSRSDSALCLAGRVAGESATRAAASAISFASSEGVANLAELLTVHSWSPKAVSRLAFFNSRTKQLDRNTGLTRLVVADGDAAFLRTLEVPEFHDCHVLGVVNRAIDRARLEAIGTKLAELRQWYELDSQVTERAPTSVPGISVSVLRQRQA